MGAFQAPHTDAFVWQHIPERVNLVWFAYKHADWYDLISLLMNFYFLYSEDSPSPYYQILATDPTV